MISDKKEKHNRFSFYKELTFIETGFRNWKKCPKAFIGHSTSEYHRDNVLLLAEEEKTGDISELISTEHKSQKANNRQVLLQVLQNIQFLSRQGLAFRHDNDNGNFDQLLKKSEQIDPRISTWLKKNRNNFLHKEHQNQTIKIMALKILQDIAKDINNSIVYTIIADEVTDASNHEQFVICLRWVDQILEVHEDFIGLQKVDNIKADTLRTATEDVLLRLAVPLQNARGQCYDGANNMVGLKSGLATQILDK